MCLDHLSTILATNPAGSLAEMEGGGEGAKETPMLFSKRNPIQILQCNILRHFNCYAHPAGLSIYALYHHVIQPTS